MSHTDQPVPCSISAWGCVYHACMSDDCQKREMIRVGDYGPGSCEDQVQHVKYIHEIRLPDDPSDPFVAEFNHCSDLYKRSQDPDIIDETAFDQFMEARMRLELGIH